MQTPGQATAATRKQQENLIMTTDNLVFTDELASETPTVNLNLEFNVVIYFEKFRVFSSSDKLGIY